MDARIHRAGAHDDAEGTADDQDKRHNAHGAAGLVAGGQALKHIVEHPLAAEILGAEERHAVAHLIAGLIQLVGKAVRHNDGTGFLGIAHHVADFLRLEAAHRDQVGQHRAEDHHRKDDDIRMRHLDGLFLLFFHDSYHFLHKIRRRCRDFHGLPRQVPTYSSLKCKKIQSKIPK